MTRRADIVHGELVGAFSRHKPEYSNMCPVCGPALHERNERARRITLIHRALVKFGYASLTLDFVANSYDRVMSGHAMESEIIDKLVASQLDEAGLLPTGAHRD